MLLCVPHPPAPVTSSLRKIVGGASKHSGAYLVDSLTISMQVDDTLSANTSGSMDADAEEVKDNKTKTKITAQEHRNGGQTIIRGVTEHSGHLSFMVLTLAD